MRRESMRHDAQAVRSAALLYLGREPRATCPDVADLRRTRVLADFRPSVDAWDQPFRIACDGDDIVVRSDGADGIAGTVDDIER